MRWQKYTKMLLVVSLGYVGSFAIVRCGREPAASQAESFPSLPATSNDVVTNDDGTKRSYGIDYAALRERSFISDDDQIKAMLTDLNSLSASDQRRTRYLTITHLYNAGVPDKELQIDAYGVAKLINSLSWGDKIVVPQAINPEKTIFRINLNDYRWNANTWQQVIAFDPYAVFRNSTSERQIAQLTGTRVPYMRADWLAFAGTQGRLYNFIMGIPGNVFTLENELGFNSDSDIRNGRVLRAGFNGSGVSQHNRLVERHSTRYGAYWKSYDFNPSNGRVQRNLFEFPLDNRNFNVNGFDFAGGEVIFNLPNGLQAYMLINNQGQRLDVAPIQIVSDPGRPDRQVHNALSCMSCHTKGMNKAVDQIRPTVERNAFAYTRTELDNVRALYPDASTLAKQYSEDAARFTHAVEQLGYSVDQPEPIIILSDRFEAEIGPELAAAELGLKPEDFITDLQRSRFLAKRFGILNVPGGHLKREVFEDNFGNIVRSLEIGQSSSTGRFDPSDGDFNQ